MQKQTKLLFLFSASAMLLNACGGGGGGTTTIAPVDTTPPTLSLKGANPLSVPLNKPFVDPGATAIDDVDGDISDKIVQINTIKTDQAGCYFQEYSVEDQAKNKSKLKRTVFVGTDAERHSPNTPPKAGEDAVTTEYTKTITFNVLANDTDSDCDPLKVGAITQATTGVAKLNADNTITYDPQNMVGSFYFTYTVSDGHGGVTTAGVSVASHDPKDGNDNWPKATADAVTTKPATPIFIDVLANDSDDDGDSLILGSVDTPRHGTIKIENNGVTYTPTAGYTGTDSFYYGVHDNHGHTDSATVTVTIAP